MTGVFARNPPEPHVEGTLAEERPIAIPHGDTNLTGSVATVPGSVAVVLIAHDGGCGRHSPEMRRHAAELRRQRFATVMVDLLLPVEVGDPERAAWMKLQVQELARRIGSARTWIAGRRDLAGLPFVLFGEGAAIAPVLLSAHARPSGVAAVAVAKSMRAVNSRSLEDREYRAGIGDPHPRSCAVSVSSR
ncbi:MAG TPA: hypothetical protein VG496_14485 [Myxococcales bacterium]|nr:hypothetical protein [Myxococcales bacterium]